MQCRKQVQDEETGGGGEPHENSIGDLEAGRRFFSSECDGGKPSEGMEIALEDPRQVTDGGR